MSDIRVTYLLINGFCFVIFLIYGMVLAQKQDKKGYYLACIFPILTYAITYGLRFGRAVDWNLYYFRYKEIGENLDNTYEVLFSLVCYVLYNIGIPYHIFIFLQCAFLMFSIFVFLRNFRQYLVFIVPLLLPLIVSNANYIRWWFAFSFFLLSLNSYLHGKNIWAILWFVCATAVHFGIILLAPVILLSPLINKAAIPPLLAIVLMVATSFVINLSSFTFLINLSSHILGSGLVEGGKTEIYLNSVNDLINGDFGRVGIFDRTFTNKIRPLLAFIPSVLFMRNYINQIRYGTFFYNLFVVGAILQPIFIVEILDRYASAFAFFSCIICGIYFYHAYKYKHTQPFVYLAIAMLGFFALVYPSLSILWIPTNDLEMMFIWNSGNRTHLSF